MHNYCRSVLVLTLAALCLMGSPGAAAQATGLEGKVFIADAGPKGKPADEKGDVITFAGGTFHSSMCDQWGFNKGIVAAVQQGGAIQFETETRSDSDGRLVWRGVVTGSVIEGTFVHYRKPAWYRPDPEPLEHWFKGVAKP
jgi:hypothetical protein